MIPIYHTYEMYEPRLPQVGDAALCGHVKRTGDPSPMGWVPAWGQSCVVCTDLELVLDEADEELAW